MNKQTTIMLLLILTLGSLCYAIYRSTSVRITQVEGTSQVVYGEPQHGLILGLCIFAGICLLGMVILLLDKTHDRRELPREEHTMLGRRPH